jgi:uncharacterized membrane protein YhiD involved in acid resistance
MQSPWGSLFLGQTWTLPQLPMISGPQMSIAQSLAALLLSIALAQILALCYQWTYQGLSYQRRFVYSLILLALMSCALILSIGQSLTLSLGVLGTMAMVRFRSNIRELWDMCFVFASLTIGISCGTQAYSIAIASTLMFVVTSSILAKTHSASKHRFDGVLRFWRKADDIGIDLEQALKEQCNYFALVSVREAQQGEIFEYSYQIRLKKKRTQGTLLSTLHQLNGVGGIQFLMQDEHLTL